MRLGRTVIVLIVTTAACVLPVPAFAAGDSAATQSVLVKSRMPLTPEVISAIAGHGVRVTYVWPEIGALAMSVSKSGMDALAADPHVAFVEIDGQASAEGRGLGHDGAGVTVAVVDSGLPQNWAEFLPPGSVDLEHATGFGAEGWGDFHNEVSAIRGVGGHIGLFPHGLAVSSVIVGFPSPLGPIGGAAPGAQILPVRVLDQFNFGWFSWFTAGILYVADLKASGALPGPVVINFSIQAVSSSAILRDAIDHAIDVGVLFVTIAGNFGPAPGSIAFPGRMQESITAGATG